MVPTYVFVVSLLGVLAFGLFKTIAAEGHPDPVDAPPTPPSVASVAPLWILMRSFASGCTAMTGVEAVSNGVSAFREPSVDYARRTLTAIIALLAILLAGIAYLCQVYGVGATEPGQAGYESILSQLVAAVVGKGVILLRHDRLGAGRAGALGEHRIRRFPEALPGHRAGRLPAACSSPTGAVGWSTRTASLCWPASRAVLLIVFGGITDSLIPLFAVGAFLAFTLSQAGMVEHWRKIGGSGALRSMAINGLGAACTAVTLAVVLVSKFAEGAWITVLLVPALFLMFAGVHAHYRALGREVTTDAPLDASGLKPPIALLPIRGWSTHHAQGAPHRHEDLARGLCPAYCRRREDRP